MPTLLTHSVPAWLPLGLAALFLAYESFRMLTTKHSEDLHGRWIDHSASQLGAVKSSLDVIAKFAENHAGGTEAHH